MRKSAEIPVSFIIILIISVVTMAAVFLFFSGQMREGGGGTTTIQATSYCSKLCLQDNQRLRSGIDFSEENKCEEVIGGGGASNFCGGNYIIAGDSTPCPDITTCKLFDMSGNKCFVSSELCP